MTWSPRLADCLPDTVGGVTCPCPPPAGAGEVLGSLCASFVCAPRALHEATSGGKSAQRLVGQGREAGGSRSSDAAGGRGGENRPISQKSLVQYEA